MSGGAGMAERRARMVRPGRLTAAVVLLTLSSGAVDAFVFIGLGAVFASVMTGNLVLLGVAVVHSRLDPALAAATAIVTYTAGVFCAASWLCRTPSPVPAGRRTRTWRGLLRRTPSGRRGRPRTRAPSGPYARTRRGLPRQASAPPHMRRGRPRRRRPGSTARRSRPGSGLASGGIRRETPGTGPGGPEWTGRVRQALMVVPVAQAAVLSGWLACHGRPGETPQLLLLGLSAFAMGVQSAGVNTLPLTGAATTYLTGTLTTLTTELATSGVRSTMRRRFAVLAAALAGAGLSGVLLTWVRPAAPALPLAATLVVILIIGTGR